MTNATKKNKKTTTVKLAWSYWFGVNSIYNFNEASSARHASTCTANINTPPCVPWHWDSIHQITQSYIRLQSFDIVITLVKHDLFKMTPLSTTFKKRSAIGTKIISGSIKSTSVPPCIGPWFLEFKSVIPCEPMPFPRNKWTALKTWKSRRWNSESIDDLETPFSSTDWSCRTSRHRLIWMHVHYRVGESNSPKPVCLLAELDQHLFDTVAIMYLEAFSWHCFVNYNVQRIHDSSAYKLQAVTAQRVDNQHASVLAILLEPKWLNNEVS